MCSDDVLKVQFMFPCRESQGNAGMIWFIDNKDVEQLHTCELLLICTTAQEMMKEETGIIDSDGGFRCIFHI